MREAAVALTFNDGLITVVAAEKVAFSRRTRDPTVAKARFASAYAALGKHFDNLRSGPQPLTHKQAVTLASEVYRQRVERLENDASVTLEAAQDVDRCDPGPLIGSEP